MDKLPLINFSPEKRQENLQKVHDFCNQQNMSWPEFIIASADLIRQTPRFYWAQEDEVAQKKSEVRMERYKKAAISAAKAQKLSYMENLLVTLHFLERAGTWILNQVKKGETPDVSGSQE